MAHDADIGPEEALIQMAYALDAAGVMAERAKDVEGMLNVGAMWMKLGESITGLSMEEAKAADILGSREPKMQIGFQGAPVEEVTIEGETDE